MSSTSAEELAAASKKAFLLLDRKGKGAVSRIDAVLALQNLNEQDFRAKAPKMEAWLEALAQPRTFSNIFDAMNASKSGHLSLHELTTFVQEQADIQQRERAAAEQTLLEEKIKEQNAAVKIEAVARGRHDRKQVVHLRERRNSAVVIQTQMRRVKAKKEVQYVRVEKKRQTVKANKRKNYRKEMEDRKLAHHSRYDAVKRRKGSLSSKQLQQATERTRKRAVAIQRKKKQEVAERVKKEEEARQKKKEQLLSIPGFGRRRSRNPKQSAGMTAQEEREPRTMRDDTELDTPSATGTADSTCCQCSERTSQRGLGTLG